MSEKPEKPKITDEQIIDELLGEIDELSSERIQREMKINPSLAEKYQSLNLAKGCIHNALLSDKKVNALKGLSSDRRSSLLAEFEKAAGRKSKRSVINFSHPMWGIGFAASLICVLSIHFIGQFGGVFSSSIEQKQQLRLHPLSEPKTEVVHPPEPPSEHDTRMYDSGESYDKLETVLQPKLEESHGITVSEEGSFGIADFVQRNESLGVYKPANSPVVEDELPVRNRMQKVGEEIRRRRAERRDRFGGLEVHKEINVLGGQPIQTNLQDIGSPITVISEDINYGQIYAPLTPASPLGDNDAPSTSLFGSLQSRDKSKADYFFVGGDEEEIFELSPFTVEGSDNSGYRATSTLAGTRLRTNYEAKPEPYTFVSVQQLEDTRSSPNRKDLRIQFDQKPRFSFVQGQNEELSPFLKKALVGSDSNSAINEQPFIFDLSKGLVGEGSATLETYNLQFDESDLNNSDQKLEKTKPEPQAQPTLLEYPSINTREDPQSTFSLNVSDVSYRLAESYLKQNAMPPAGTFRTEEFINAFDYQDPSPPLKRKVGFNWERAKWPFAHDRDFMRFSIQTAAEGRTKLTPLHIVLAIDASGSMARPDRVEIVNALSSSLATTLGPNDRVSVIRFEREARLVLDGQQMTDPAILQNLTSKLNPQGGTDFESAINLAYDTAQRHYSEKAINRILLITDGAANLGSTNLVEMRKLVEDGRKRGIALDCFGIGFDGHDDAFLESLARNGDGRYRFLRSAEEAEVEMGEKLAGILRPAAFDVKVQVEFNPDRVELYQQLGYQQHQIADIDFRNNAIDAAELGAAESGNAAYLVKVLSDGSGPIGLVRVRYRNAETNDYQEMSWNLPYSENVSSMNDASPSLRLAAVATIFAAKLNDSPFANEISFYNLFELSRDLPRHFPNQRRAVQLPVLIFNAQSLSGKR